MLVVIALGGNALLQRGQPMTEQQQRVNVKKAAKALAVVARKHTIVITHGNGRRWGCWLCRAPPIQQWNRARLMHRER